MLSFIQIVFLVLSQGQSSPKPEISCTKPAYFNQTKWISDSTGGRGYRFSIMKQIATDSLLIGAPKFLIECIFLSPSDIFKKDGMEYMSYNWWYKGYSCLVVFKIKDDEVFEIRHFKGCG